MIWEITTPSRLHFGFIELDQNAPRYFGSLGVALQSPKYRITYHSASKLLVDGDARHEIHRLTECFDKHFGVRSNGRIVTHESIPRHSGLGSGTQLALAIGHLLARVHQLNLSSQQIAEVFARGKRSGIGIATFNHGGFVVDAGKSEPHQIPPAIIRIAFPEEWRIILLFNQSMPKGLHGVAELDAFDNLRQQKVFYSKQLSYIILMAILPSLIERDYDGFSQALEQFQQIIGDFFAPIQGGRYRNQEIGKILKYLNKENSCAVGQSSWGPTGYVITRNHEHARKVKDLIKSFITRSSDVSTKHIDMLDTTVDLRGSVMERITRQGV